MQRYHVFLEKKALKQLEKLDRDTRSRIVEALCTLQDEGFSRRLDIAKLRGYKNQYCLQTANFHGIKTRAYPSSEELDI